MLRLVLADLLASFRRPQVAVLALLLIAIPPLSGYVVLPAYAFDHWTSYFTVMFEGLGLAFPLFVALLTQPRLLDEWSNTFALATRARVAPRRYFGARLATSAAIAFVVFLALTAACFAMAKATYSFPAGEVPPSVHVELRLQFSQLWSVSPMLYVAVYCLWVALVAATVAAFCTLVTALVGNKFLALAAPFLLWQIVNFTLAALSLEAFALPPFRFHITQQPVWTELVGWAGILTVIAVLYTYAHRRDYQTPGIVRL